MSRALRAVPKKAAAQLPQNARYHFLADAARACATVSLDLAEWLGRSALQVADDPAAAVGRRDLNRLCSGCGVPIAAATCAKVDVVSISTRTRRRGTLASASPVQQPQGPPGGMAVLKICQVCGQTNKQITSAAGAEQLVAELTQQQQQTTPTTQQQQQRQQPGTQQQREVQQQQQQVQQGLSSAQQQQPTLSPPQQLQHQLLSAGVNLTASHIQASPDASEQPALQQATQPLMHVTAVATVLVERLHNQANEQTPDVVVINSDADVDDAVHVAVRADAAVQEVVTMAEQQPCFSALEVVALHGSDGVQQAPGSIVQTGDQGTVEVDGQQGLTGKSTDAGMLPVVHVGIGEQQGREVVAQLQPTVVVGIEKASVEALQGAEAVELSLGVDTLHVAGVVVMDAGVVAGVVEAPAGHDAAVEGAVAAMHMDICTAYDAVVDEPAADKLAITPAPSVSQVAEVRLGISAPQLQEELPNISTQSDADGGVQLGTSARDAASASTNTAGAHMPATATAPQADSVGAQASVAAVAATSVGNGRLGKRRRELEPPTVQTGAIMNSKQRTPAGAAAVENHDSFSNAPSAFLVTIPQEAASPAEVKAAKHVVNKPVQQAAAKQVASQPAQAVAGGAAVVVGSTCLDELLSVEGIEDEREGTKKRNRKQKEKAQQQHWQQLDSLDRALAQKPGHVYVKREGIPPSNTVHGGAVHDAGFTKGLAGIAAGTAGKADSTAEPVGNAGTSPKSGSILGDASNSEAETGDSDAVVSLGDLHAVGMHGLRPGFISGPFLFRHHPWFVRKRLRANAVLLAKYKRFIGGRQ